MLQALSDSPASPAPHSSLPLAAADLLPVIMEQLEACATADAHIEGPPELEAAVAGTLKSVRMHVAESHAKLRTLRRRGHPKVGRRSLPCITQRWPGAFWLLHWVSTDTQLGCQAQMPDVSTKRNDSRTEHLLYL